MMNFTNNIRWRQFLRWCQKWNRKNYIIGASGAVVLFVFVIIFWIATSPPSDFPAGKVIAVEEGQNLQEVAADMADKNVVRVSSLFQAIAIISGGERGVIAGDYYFENPLSVFEVTRRLTRGDYRLDPWNVTVPEGSSIDQMADIFSMVIPEFDRSKFLRLANDYRGYLFPDTYSVTPLTTEKDIIEEMVNTFGRRIQKIENEIYEFGRPLKEVVIMASILEAEASTTEDRRKIAGVLWERIKIGMPLQVDAAFVRVNGKTTYELTLDDLAEDDPFNTYTNTGLPPQPITNPGLDALKAAVTPIEEGYLYYLSDRSGNTYYSETFDEHKQKKAIYVN